MKSFKSILGIFLLLNSISFAQPGSNDSYFNLIDQGLYGTGVGMSAPLTYSVIQPDGKILVGGANSTTSFDYNGNVQYGISRINPNGILDSTFDIGMGFNFWTEAFVLQSDGKIIVVGEFTVCNGINRNRIARLNDDGSVDTSFDPGTGFPLGSSITSVALQTDGKIIVAGNFNSFNGFSRSRIVRLNTDGSIDLSYLIGTGFTGISSSVIKSIKLQTDGKLIAVGSFSGYNGTARNNIARINPDGSHDLTFNPGPGFNGSVWDVDIQPDGKVLAVGGFSTFYSQSRSRIARLNSNGTIDASFIVGSGFDSGYATTVKVKNDGSIMVGGTHDSYNGIVCNFLIKLNSTGIADSVFSSNLGTALNSQVEYISIQNDGKVIVFGSFNSYNNIETGGMLRINEDGILDETFNSGTGFNDYVNKIMVQPDGNIVVVGNFTKYNGRIQKRITRLQSNGIIDTSFNTGIGFNNTVSSLCIQSDGKIVVAGEFSTYNGTPRLRIARLNIDGSLDTTFNPGNGFNNYVRSICIQGDGKILVGGGFTMFNGNIQNRLVRLNSDGSLDQTFSSNANNDVYSIILQSDGKILVSGAMTYYNSNIVNKVLRLNADGSIDQTFNPGNGANTYIVSSDIQVDGKILVGGDFTTFNGISRNGLARLNSNGSLDASFNLGSGFDGMIRTISIQNDGKIIVGGSFTLFNGTTRNGIVRLNNNGSLDLTFNSGSGFNDNVLSCFVLTDEKILVGGSFYKYNGIPRNGIARLLNCYPSNNIITASACDSYVLNSQNYTSSGIYTQTLVNFQGCDSIITLNLSIQQTNDTLFVSTCDFYIWSGQSYTSSGYYSHQYTNIYGCDSTITLCLIVNSPTSSTINFTECESYSFNGNQLNISGQYIDTVPNIAGCDSIITLNLTILNSTSASENQTMCESYYWPINGQIYFNSGQYMDTIPNAMGCDSVVTLNLTILQPSISTVTETACGSYTWPINNQIYNSGGQYFDTIPNVAGCDSVIILNLIIIPTNPLSLDNAFLLPSSSINCNGEVALTISGNAPFNLDFDAGTNQVVSNGYSLVPNLCAGVHDLRIIDNCGDSLITQFVIPIDSNYVFTNPFVDSLAMDSLGVTLTNCDIYYNSIDTAYIDSIWATGNTVNVIWNIVDSNGSNFDTTSYVLNNGTGVYWLQLSIFCPTKAFGDYFTVTEAIYFGDGYISTAGLSDKEMEEVFIFPNPTSNDVTLKFESPSAMLNVFDAQGKLIQQQSIISGSTIDLSKVETGVYFFELTTEKGKVVRRVVKN